MVLLLGSGFLVLAGIGLTLFINTSRVDDTLAGESQEQVRIVTVPEQEFLNDKALPAPVFAPAAPPQGKIQQVRIAKELRTDAQTYLR